MIRMNNNYTKLQASYLFSDIAKRVQAFQDANPDREIIKLGIGDVTLPLPSACISAFQQGVQEMSDERSFRGYGPEQGYDFLRKAVAENDYQAHDIDVGAEAIFISDGAKCDTGNFQELFSLDSKVAVPDPVYPVYVDTNVMAGRTGGWTNGRYEGLTYLEGNEKNGFIPDPPSSQVDLIYLCFPNNPTGAVATFDQLKKWVDYAHEHKSLILFDAAYESFVRTPGLPRSIFEVEGAKSVAVEFRSFSKTAGFTGTRCAFTVIPNECMVYTDAGEKTALRDMWNRRHTTKFNGVSYPVQKAAAAIYTDEGKTQVRSLTDYYMENAKIILAELQTAGYTSFGGTDSPYIWVKTGGDSWEFFDLLLRDAGVVTTPGSGFGKCGEGYVRISSFNDRDKVIEAMGKVTAALRS